jgi:HK97 family phage portal protein
MGMTLNGWHGVSPITYAREAIAMSLATEKFGGKLFANGAKMSGILTYPGRFKDKETAGKVGRAFDEAASGDNAHSTIVLEEGMKWDKVSMTSEDSQFLQTRGFQIPEIARFFRVPLHKIQELTRATFSNIEQQALEFLTDCLMPWLVRWEQSLNTQLLTPIEQTEYYFEFLLDGLLRGDTTNRYAAYGSAIRNGWMTRNEARVRENMNADNKDLDEFLVPLNMGKPGQEDANAVATQ